MSQCFFHAVQGTDEIVNMAAVPPGGGKRGNKWSSAKFCCFEGGGVS
jgi:hypothetical protein